MEHVLVVLGLLIFAWQIGNSRVRE